eukprot:567302-Rhodomonas_salina.2
MSGTGMVYGTTAQRLHDIRPIVLRWRMVLSSSPSTRSAELRWRMARNIYLKCGPAFKLDFEDLDAAAEQSKHREVRPDQLHSTAVSVQCLPETERMVFDFADQLHSTAISVQYAPVPGKVEDCLWFRLKVV